MAVVFLNEKEIVYKIVYKYFPLGSTNRQVSNIKIYGGEKTQFSYKALTVIILFFLRNIK